MSRLVESCPGNGKTALFAGNAGSGPGALLRRLRRRAARKAGFAAKGGEGQRPPYTAQLHKTGKALPASSYSTKSLAGRTAYPSMPDLTCPTSFPASSR